MLDVWIGASGPCTPRHLHTPTWVTEEGVVVAQSTPETTKARMHALNEMLPDQHVPF